MNDPLEREADEAADRVMRMADPKISHGAPPTLSRKCEHCEEEEKKDPLQRRASGTTASSEAAPPIVDAVLASPGRPLDASTQQFMGNRFGGDFSDVRIHTDAQAAQSAAAVEARAYTVGRNIVFGQGQYDPAGHDGRRLLAHELAHVVQQGDTQDRVRRTPARQVSCSGHLPLHVPAQADVDDPVAVITAAEDRAGQMMDDTIDSLEFGRQQILAGAPTAWPTISDALAQGLRLMGLDPEDRAIWTAPMGTGNRSVPLLIRRLRLIRSTIGAGSFFFVCLGTGVRRLGTCTPAAGNPDICTDAEAATCAGEFFTAFCPGFWAQGPEEQAATLLHETSHNFATFIGHTGRFTNAECFARLVQVFAGVPEALQRVDLCPNP